MFLLQRLALCWAFLRRGRDMASVTLKSLLRPTSKSAPLFSAIMKAAREEISIVDAQDNLLMGIAPETVSENCVRIPIVFEGEILGHVLGPPEIAEVAALLLVHLKSQESEGRALASEVLHLYREVHLIEQLSEQLVALLDSTAVAESALAQAQRLISATHGSVLVLERRSGRPEQAARFGEFTETRNPLGPGSSFAMSILERGMGEIVNDCAAD